jgi:hypothetical protein
LALAALAVALHSEAALLLLMEGTLHFQPLLLLVGVMPLLVVFIRQDKAALAAVVVLIIQTVPQVMYLALLHLKEIMAAIMLHPAVVAVAVAGLLR